MEYENLFTALQICLEKEGKIDIYQCLYKYLVIINDYRSCLNIDKFICEKVEQYSQDFKETNLGIDSIIPFFLKANNYLRLKQESVAKEAYLQVVKLLESLKNVEEAEKQSILPAFLTNSAIAKLQTIM